MRLRPIIVLGPERTGTSLVAEMVHAWGAYAGEPEDLSSPDHRNPRGYWEYEPLWALAERVGDFAAGVSWWEASFEARLVASRDHPSHASEARRLVATMEAAGRPWMWKDPALCHMLPFWSAFLTAPIFILTVRHPVDVARSWSEFAVGTDRLPTTEACNLLRWQHMALAAIEGTDGADTIYVEYEHLLADADAAAHRIADFLATQCATHPGTDAIGRMAAACVPRLQHHSAGIGDQSTALSRAQRRLYELQRARVTDPTAPYERSALAAADGWRALVIGEERGAADKGE